MLPPRDYEFEQMVRKAVLKNQVGGIIGIIFLALLAVFFLGFGFAMLFVPLILLGLLPAFFIVFILSKFSGDFKGGEYWIRLFTTEPQKIIWIKPVRINHTAYYVVTLYSDMHFQILTSDNKTIMIKCNSQHDQFILTRGLRYYAPHAHFGYSSEVQFYYRKYRAEFLRELQENNLYMPIGSMRID